MALAPVTGLYVSEVMARDGADCDIDAFLENQHGLRICTETME
jgi:hypothetical protein